MAADPWVVVNRIIINAAPERQSHAQLPPRPPPRPPPRRPADDRLVEHERVEGAWSGELGEPERSRKTLLLASVCLVLYSTYFILLTLFLELLSNLWLRVSAKVSRVSPSQQAARRAPAAAMSGGYRGEGVVDSDHPRGRSASRALGASTALG